MVTGGGRRERYWWYGWEWCGVVVETMRGTARMYWWGLMRIDLYGVKAAMVCERLANNKKSHPGPNSFSQFFIFPASDTNFDFLLLVNPNFFLEEEPKETLLQSYSTNSLISLMHCLIISSARSDRSISKSTTSDPFLKISIHSNDILAQNPSPTLRT